MEGYRAEIMEEYGELINRGELIHILAENNCTFEEFTKETDDKGPFYDTSLVIDHLGF